MNRFHNLSPALLTVIAFLFCSAAVFGLTSIMAGDMEITSRLMTFENNIYVAKGGIKATRADSTLTADRGIYDRTLELVKAIDNVVVTQPGSTLTSDYLEAYVKEDRMLAKGTPKLERIVERESRDEAGVLTKKKSRVILTCNEVEAFNKENRFLAKGNVHVIEIPYREGETPEEAKENEKDPTSDLVCDTLELFSAEDKAIARTDVVIKTKTLKATGDKAIYLDRENRMIIVGHAHAWQTAKESPGAEEQVSELYASKIIYYPNEDRTIAVGEVHATVYPKGQRGPDDEKGKRKERKKKKKADGEAGTASGTAETAEEPTAQGAAGEEAAVVEAGSDSGEEPAESAGETATQLSPPADLPPGDYTPVGGDTDGESPE